MKVLLLADINSIHTQKWAIALQGRGICTGVFSLTRLRRPVPELENLFLFYPDHLNRDISSSGLWHKIKYFTVLPSVRKCIGIFAPDIVHAHYASSYGILGSLSGFHPYFLSVWGSDIYDFPKSSFPARLLIRYSLKQADRILSTSHVMAKETQKYTGKKVYVTPFGIDLDRFRRYKPEQRHSADSIVIGTIKSLETKYGIGYLIEVFARLHSKYPELPMKLHIAGDGSQEAILKAKAQMLGLENYVTFFGKIPHEKVPEHLNLMDIYAALSISDSESFGVAVIEASACELPVVVTNIGGLKEVVEDQVTGFLVPPRNVEKSLKSFEKLLFSEPFRREMGCNGRERVKKLYNWKDNVDEMIKIYQQFF